VHDGHFDVDGIVLDRDAQRSMELSSGSGNITVQGR